jgi:hypothetical protein
MIQNNIQYKDFNNLISQIKDNNNNNYNNDTDILTSQIIIINNGSE